MAVAARGGSVTGVIFHADRGSQHQRLFNTMHQARLEIFQRLTYYNTRRRRSALNYLSPAEFQQQRQQGRKLTLAARTPPVHTPGDASEPVCHRTCGQQPDAVGASEGLSPPSGRSVRLVSLRFRRTGVASHGSAVGAHGGVKAAIRRTHTTSGAGTSQASARRVMRKVVDRLRFHSRLCWSAPDCGWRGCAGLFRGGLTSG
ncbi:IS3 family transposase [Streptomyces sp. NPDC059165]|uniref:IS3 family transposase n=1 Tax=Streptomyces sp. NPDC059165 TaxID=3346751 RepID=UPI0036ABC92A